MCGLVGMTIAAENGFTQSELNLAIMMMFLNQIRGRDSTGVVGVTNYGSRYWAKEVGGLDALMKTKNWDDWEKTTFQNGKLFFGHGRYATKGEVSIGNSHPFEVEKEEGKKKYITLVHNGTLDDFQTLEGRRDFAVDSHWLTHCIAKHGPEESFKKIKGAIATIWWDEGEETLNFYRNFERPLYYVFDGRRQLYLNSERDSLIYFKHKFSLDYKIEDIKDVPVNTLHTLDFQNLKEMTTKKIEPLVSHHVTSYTSSRRHSKLWDTEEYSHWKNERTYEEDVQSLHEDRLISVSFEKKADGWWRITKHVSGTVIQTKTDPYLPGLLKMYKDTNGPVKIDWEESSTTMVAPTEKKEESNLFTPSIVVKTGPGVVTKFRKNLAGQRAVSGKIQNQYSHPTKLLSYKTNLGENLKVSDLITVEVADIQETSIKGTLKCTGFRVVEPLDQTVLCYFFTTLSKSQVEKISFFEGVVDGLEVTSTKEFEMSNSLIAASMCNVRPLPTELSEHANLH